VQSYIRLLLGSNAERSTEQTAVNGKKREHCLKACSQVGMGEVEQEDIGSGTMWEG